MPPAPKRRNRGQRPRDEGDIDVPPEDEPPDEEPQAQGRFDGTGTPDAPGGVEVIVQVFYDMLIADFTNRESTWKPDPERLGLPNAAGYEEMPQWVPHHNWLFKICRANKLYNAVCKQLGPYALSVERRYWKDVTDPFAPAITLEEVLKVIRAREGFEINATTGEATYEKVTRGTKKKWRASWKDVIAHLIRARYYYPYHDSRCRSDLHGKTNVCPVHAINGDAPSNLSARVDPNEIFNLQAAVTTGQWNYGNDKYRYYQSGSSQPLVDVPRADFTFYQGQTEMTLHEAAAYVAAGQQAVVLNDVIKALAKAFDKARARRGNDMSDIDWLQVSKAIRNVYMDIPNAHENHAISIEKAKWVLARYGPVEAWRITGTQIDLYGINPANVQRTLDPFPDVGSAVAGVSFGGVTGGGGLRLSRTWAQPPGVVTDLTRRPQIDRVLEGLRLLDKYEPDLADDRYDAERYEGGYSDDLPLVLSGLGMPAMEALQMSHINWKIGAWFMPGRNTSTTPCTLYNLRSAFEDNRFFNQYIGDWDVSAVTSMHATFRDAESFNQSLRDWMVNNVIDWHATFYGCREFDQTLETWVDRMFGERMQAGPSHMTFAEACEAAGGARVSIKMMQTFDRMHYLAYATEKWLSGRGINPYSGGGPQEYLNTWGPPWWGLEERSKQRSG